MPLTICSCSCRHPTILFLCPLYDNSLHLTIYIKFLAFVLAKPFIKSQFPKVLPWNHLRGKHFLKMAWKERDDGSHHYLSRVTSLHHSVVHPATPVFGNSGSLRGRNSYCTHCLWHSHLWPGSSSPGHSVGLDSLSFHQAGQVALVSSSLCPVGFWRQR